MNESLPIAEKDAAGRRGCVVPKRHPGDAAVCATSCWQERIGKGHCPAGPLPDAEKDVDRRRVERAIQSLIDSPIGNRCVTCGHVKHNELGYCQNGQCICGDGTTVAGLAGIIRRDLPPGGGRA